MVNRQDRCKAATRAKERGIAACERQEAPRPSSNQGIEEGACSLPRQVGEILFSSRPKFFFFSLGLLYDLIITKRKKDLISYFSYFRFIDKSTPYSSFL